MTSYELIIVGGGASGLFAGARAVDLGIGVCILEKNPFCGKKIGITGKGRCNITNTTPWDEFSKHIHPSYNFFKSAFFSMNNEATIEYFNSIGLPTVVERGSRVYPQSMCAKDVSMALAAHIRENGGTIITDFEVEGVNCSEIEDGCKNRGNRRFAVNGRDTKGELVLYSNFVLIATGGLSYPSTGSTGDGYRFAESFGHSVTKRFPSLTALKPENYTSLFPDITGKSLEVKNCEISLDINGAIVQREFGDVTFTDGGIEGPIGFKISRKAVENLNNGQKVKVHLDLKPAVSIKQLLARIEREMSERKTGAGVNGVLRSLLPAVLIEPFCKANGARNSWNAADTAEKLKNWEFRIVDYVGYSRAVVTAGGVSTKEVSQKTMESKLIPDLYFAGEILDLDADTGGYNLQIAFSTASLAIDSIAKKNGSVL